jgi:hypothetical protein
MNNTDIENDISFKEIIVLLWKGKFFIFFTTVLLLCVGVFYLQNTEVNHSITITYQKVEKDEPGNNSFGGFASLAGAVLPEIGQSTGGMDVFEALIVSEDVAEIVFKNPRLVQSFFRNEFDEKTNKYRRPEVSKIGSYRKKLRAIITGREELPYQQPNPARFAGIIKDAFAVSILKKSGFLQLYAETSQINLTIELMEAVTKATDDLLKKRNFEVSSRSLRFYQEKISRAKSREHREALAKLIVAEEKKLMLASTGTNYIVERIMYPQVSLKPTSPKVMLTLLLSLLSGVLLGIILILIRKFIK